MPTINEAIEFLEEQRRQLGGTSHIMTTRDGKSVHPVKFAIANVGRDLGPCKIKKHGTPTVFVVLK